MAAAVSSFPTLFIALPCIIFAAMLIAIYHWFAVNCDFRRSLNADERPPVAASSIGVDEVVVIDVLAAQAVPSSAETNGKSDSMAAVAPSTASDADGEGEKRTCPICLVELGDGDGIRVLPDCMHGFHVQCIETWLELHSTCPVCRAKIGRDEELPEACP